jgi:hypothetical protein
MFSGCSQSFPANVWAVSILNHKPFPSKFFQIHLSSSHSTQRSPDTTKENNDIYWGRAIAQALSRWLPTTVARVQTRVWSRGICGGQSGAGPGFLRVLRFPLPIFIPPISPHSPSPIIWGWYNGPVVAAERRDSVSPNLTQRRTDWR